jgi:hypothetical protein
MNMYNLYESTEETLKQLQNTPKQHTAYDNGWKYSFKNVYDIETSETGISEMKIHINIIINLQDNLKMGTNMFCGAMYHVLQYIKESVPSITSEDLGSHVTIQLNSVEVEYGLGVMDIFEFMDRPIVNELRVPRELSQLLRDGTEEYCLATGDQVPRFEEGFMDEVTRMTKKAKVVYKALMKGTLDGEPYVLPNSPIIIVRQMRRRFDFDSKVLRPDLLANIFVHGRYQGNQDKDRLTAYLKERFKSFGIEFTNMAYN